MNEYPKPADQIVVNGKSIDRFGAYIIAEMACAHDGDYQKARDLIDVAVEAKADAVQLQFFHAPANMVAHHRLYGLLEKIEFNETQWADLCDYARQKKIDVFACAYDMPSLDLAIALSVDGIKFNSADLSNLEMIERVATSGIPFTLGTGASRMDEIGLAISTALAKGSNKFILMHGMQSFPTVIEQANIRRIYALTATFNALVGYADHTDGDDSFASQIDLLAMGAGACVFEKHYTLDRSLKGTDYQAALNPGELTNYIKAIRNASKAMGSSAIKPFNADELRYRTFQKKKIVAYASIPAGHILNRRDIVLLRTEDEGALDATSLFSLIGKEVKQAIEAQQPIRLENIKS